MHRIPRRSAARPRLLAAVAGATLLAVAVFVGCQATTPRPAGVVEGRLAPCPSSANCVSSEASGASFIRPLGPFDDAPAAFRALIRSLRSEDGVEVRMIGPDYAWVVCYTPVLKFADDLELRLDAPAGLVHVRSASRLGYSDLGVNRERVERLRAALEAWRSARR